MQHAETSTPIINCVRLWLGRKPERLQMSPLSTLWFHPRRLPSCWLPLHLQSYDNVASSSFLFCVLFLFVVFAVAKFCQGCIGHDEGMLVCSLFLGGEMTSHIPSCTKRPFECEHCHKIGAQDFITSPRHQRQCPNLPSSCPKGCGEDLMPRDFVEVHLKESCLLACVACPFKDLGWYTHMHTHTRARTHTHTHAHTHAHTRDILRASSIL